MCIFPLPRSGSGKRKVKVILCCHRPKKAQPFWASPFDCFGFHVSCCRCIPLRNAAVFISFTTMIWAAADLYMVHKFLSKVIENKDVLKICKMVHYGVSGGLVVAALVLLLGALLQKYSLVNFFVWYTLIYGFLSLILYVGVTGTFIAKATLKRKTIFQLIVKIGLTAVWYSISIYFLIIVNSYKWSLL